MDIAGVKKWIMERRKFRREFKLAAVKSIKERGVAVIASERPEIRAMFDFLKEAVFNRRRMWFADQFESPREEWRATFREMLAANAGVSLH